MEQGARRWLVRAGCVLFVAVLAGCEAFRAFGDYKTAESADVETAPWPRLVDVPDAPPPGRYGPGVPDPTTGEAVRAALSERGRAAAERRQRLEAPVLDAQSRDALSRP